ncbi:MAG: diguanylate cyclase [Cyanobacteriota bacterium]|nr:diguanylate cyclase [Cyanobacteriota bacterium]
MYPIFFLGTLFVNSCHWDRTSRISSNLLIVDRAELFSSELCKTLENLEYCVFRQSIEDDIIQTAIESKIQLILLEINLPTVDVYELCSQLQSSSKTRHIPLIFVSAIDDLKNKIVAFNMGGADFIAKPFQEAELVARINNQIAIARERQHLQQQAQKLREQNAKLQREVQQHQQTQIELEKEHQTLECLVTSDGLTGIANRRQFDLYFVQEWRRCSRERQPLSLLLCDIDYFKKYNDSCGHLAGDRCLRAVAQTLKATLKRPADLVARYGGEEFAIVLPNTDVSGARHMSMTIRDAIEQLQLPHPRSNVSPYVTMSLGGISFWPTREVRTQAAIARADKQLYQAKERGRNGYCLDSERTLSVEVSL